MPTYVIHHIKDLQPAASSVSAQPPAMTALKITVVAVCLAMVSGDYSGPSPSLTSSYGVPSTDSYSSGYGDHGGHGGHETVKRHIYGGGYGQQNCCCGGGSSGTHGGGVQSGPCYPPSAGYPVYAPQPSPPSASYPVYAPQPSPPSVSHPVYAPQPSPPSAGHPVYAPQPSPPSGGHPVYAPQPSPPSGGHLLYAPQPSPPSVDHPVYSPQPSPPSAGHPVYAPQPSPPSGGHPVYAPQPSHYPVYSERQPSYSGGPVYTGGRPDYAVFPYGGHGGYGGYGGYGLSTKPYQFGYSVNDQHTGADFRQQETSDGNTVKGQYRVQLPDGRTQVVTYTADWQTGFHADVQYEGVASYPANYGTGGSYPPSTGSSYGTPSAHPGGSYGVPSPPTGSYGAPPSPSGSYGAPSTPSSSYGVPSHQGGYQGGSYQSRVGVAGTGTQYNHIGHPTGGSTYSAPPSSSYHPSGYRK